MQSDSAEGGTQSFPELRTRAWPASSDVGQWPQTLTRPWGSWGSLTSFPVLQPLVSPAPGSSPSSPAEGTLFEWLHLTDVQTEVFRKREVEESMLTGGELEFRGSGVLGHKGFPEDEGLGDLGGRSIEGGRGRTPMGSALPTPSYLQR